MYVPITKSGYSQGWGALTRFFGNSLWKRQTTGSETDVSALSLQWSNPSDVSTILMIVGGDVVQNALAQSTGTWITPVCFSFGWVSYAYVALIHVIGDGRLLPPPDYPVKVFNLNSGYARDNKNWVIGRLLRDTEAWLERREPLNDEGIRISIFEAQKRNNGGNPITFLPDWSHFCGVVVMVVQLLVASIPIVLNDEWAVLMITAAGTILAQAAGALPQWRAEKLPNRQHSDAIFALTTGNGSKDIMVIIGKGQCLDLEEFSVSDTPRNGRPWEKFIQFSKTRKDRDGKPKLHRTGTELRKSRTTFGLPMGFFFTRITCVIQSILWILLLVNVAAIKVDTWYLLLVGGIGMFQNGVLAAMERPPKTRNIPLRHTETIMKKKVMDGLMDFEHTYHCGRPLLREFFPGDLRPAEKDWWEGRPKVYDEKREAERNQRGLPRSLLPPMKNTFDEHIPKHRLINKEQSSDPFSDPEGMKDNATIPRGTSWAAAAISPIKKPEEIVLQSGHVSLSSLNKISKPSQYLSMTTSENRPTQASQTFDSAPSRKTTGSVLSPEEIVSCTRSPDWTY